MFRPPLTPWLRALRGALWVLLVLSVYVMIYLVLSG